MRTILVKGQIDPEMFTRAEAKALGEYFVKLACEARRNLLKEASGARMYDFRLNFQFSAEVQEPKPDAPWFT